MTAGTAIRLAAGGRERAMLVAGSCAAAGALLLATAHIVRMPTDQPRELSHLATESGLRPGVVIAALLLVVPVLALTVQALRVGSVARDRRMAALRLAGATPRDVRAIAAAEAGVAAAAGGALAGPAYLVVWVLAGVLPPPGGRLLDAPDLLDLPAWAALVLLAALAGAVAGAAIQGRVVVEPLGVQRRERPAAPGRVGLALLVVGAALVAGGFVALPLTNDEATNLATLVAMMIGVLLAAFAGAPRFVLLCARVLERRGDPISLLAGRRLQADPRSPGRGAAVLFVCGVALGMQALLASDWLQYSEDISEDAAFYLGGVGLAAAAVLVAVVVTLVTLLVGAADGLLDARRPLAALAALAVDEPLMTRVVARQLAATAVPAIVAGTIVGGPAIWVAIGGATTAPLLLAGIAVTVGSGLLIALAARLAARVLRPLVRAAMAPENLRAP